MKFVVETLSEKLFCNELNVKQYKELLKCSYGDEPDKYIFCETICDILQDVLNKTTSEIKNLNIVDLALIIIQLKTNSHGNVIKVIVKKDEKDMTLDLNLNNIIQSILTLYSPYKSYLINESNIEMELGIPSLARCLSTTSDVYTLFLKSLTINNQTYKLTTNEEAEEVFNNLPLKAGRLFIKKCKEIFTQCNQTDFLEKYQTKQRLTFVPSIDDVIWYTKLIFSEPLNVLYDNMFYLSHYGHIDIKSLEALSPGEYIYMTKTLEKTLSQKNSSEPTDQGMQDVSGEEFDESGLI